jgi:uncharacterized protein YjbJ (UPF0337 family)
MPYRTCINRHDCYKRGCFRTEPFGHLFTEKREPTGGLTMSFTDKAKNKAEEMTGKAKQTIGDATDNESMVADGAREEAAAKAKQAGENVKDAGKDVRDAFS